MRKESICEVCSKGSQVLTRIGKTWTCTECIKKGIEFAAKEAHKKRNKCVA